MISCSRSLLLTDILFMLCLQNMFDDMLRTFLRTFTAVYTFCIINTRNIVNDGNRTVLAGLLT